MRKYFLITEKGCRYLLYRVNGLTKAHIEEWFGKTPEKVAVAINGALLKTSENISNVSKAVQKSGEVFEFIKEVIERKEEEFIQENQATDKLGDITKTETSKVVGKLYVSELEESRKKNEELTEKLIQEREEDMNEIQLLEQREVLGKQFKIYGTVDEPIFLAKDVAEWIEHNKPSEMITNVDEDEKVKIFINPSDSIAGVLQKNTEYWFLTEEGLYEVLMQSRKPIAKEFKKQVKSILKDIRKHGMYATDELLDNPDLLIQVATKLKEEKEKNIFLLSENKQQEKRIKHLEPHANFSKEYLKSEDTVAQLYLTVEKCTIFSRNYG